MAVTFLVSKCAYLNSQRLYRPISRTFSQVTFGAFMTLESRKKSSHQCVLGIFGINQGPNSHKPDTYSTWTAHPSRLLGCAVQHYRALAFGRPQNDGTRSFYFETTSKPGENFIALHLGSYQGVFYYKKTRPCLFCSCPATCEVAFFTSTFLRNYFLSQEMMCALRNCYQVQPR